MSKVRPVTECLGGVPEGVNAAKSGLPREGGQNNGGKLEQKTGPSSGSVAVCPASGKLPASTRRAMKAFFLLPSSGSPLQTLSNLRARLLVGAATVGRILTMGPTVSGSALRLRWQMRLVLAEVLLQIIVDDM